MSNAIERLRQLLGSNSWNYCVLWKLSDDQRFLELVECCCGGNNESSIENRNGEGEEFGFLCRDVMCQHPRTTSCEALAQLPTSQPLDGINMETLISNQPRWLNFSNISDSSIAQLSVGTKVLIPIPGGLVELYAAKQLNEDQTVIDYVIAQFTPLMEQEAMNNASNMCPRFSININMINDLQTFAPSSDQSNANQITDHMNLPAACDTTAADQMCTPNSSMNFLQQISYASENNKGIRNEFLEGSNDSFQASIDHHSQQLNSFRTLSENGFEELMNNATNMHNLHVLEPPANEQQAGNEKGSLLNHEMGRADSISDSDHLDDEDDPKYRRRAGKGPQSKNLVAERKRRKKLNERLYHLRSLVPNISKLDRASILGDAIEYVQELQKEANDLQNELERNSDDEGANQNNMINHHHNLHRNNFSSEVSNPIGAAFGPDYDHENPINGFHSENIKGSQNFENANDKAQQMEVQVEVAQLEGNDFFVKVFGEQKKGGFVRLMEALSCLGMEITNVNMTSCISLVSYVFIVKKRDSEMVQAEYLRDSLLEATRTQAGFWTEMAKASENESGIDHHHQHHQHHLHSHHMGPFHHHFHHLSNN